MLNAGLKDTRYKVEIPSSIIKLTSNGNSDALMTFENREYLELDSSGETTATLDYISVYALALDASGDTTAVMTIIDKPDVIPEVIEVLTFKSKMFLNITGKSKVTLEDTNSSPITTVINLKSKIDE